MTVDANWIALAALIAFAIAAGIAFRLWLALRWGPRDFDDAWARANTDWESRHRRRDNRRDEHADWLGVGGGSFLHGEAE